jgi:hypothetical protein
MRLNLPTAALFGAIFFVPFSLFSTSVVPFANLGEATTYSEAVVLARAVETLETDQNGATYQETRFESLESVKGSLSAGASFLLRPWSRRGTDFKIDISGDFKPELGKTYLLFLQKHGDVWRPVMLSFYVFEQIRLDDDAFLVPVGGQGMELVSRPDGVAVEPLSVFQQNLLLQQLQVFSSTPTAIWDGNIGRSSLQPQDFIALDRAVPNGCDFTLGGANLSRWQDAAIPLFYDDTNIPAGWGGSFSNILNELTGNYTGITPSNAGAVSYVPDCADGAIGFNSNFIDFCDNDLNGSQSTLLIFDDPCDEIPNLNNCLGTLAFGGSYSSSTTHLFDGVEWDDALYGFVVVNNGTPTCLSSNQFELMMVHELTHVYRMGHLNATNFPNQNMNPICCNDINTKDRECMNYAYPAPAPVELSVYEVQLEGEKAVRLRWETETEKDNDYFSIRRSGNGLQFTEIQQVKSLGSPNGGVYEWLDERPLPGQNYYLLSQTDFDGTVQNLGIKAVTVGRSEGSLRISPNPLHSDVLSFSVVLTDDFDGTLEVLDTDGRLVVSASVTLEKGAKQVQQILESQPAGVYLLRLYDGQQQWSARFLNP